MSTPPHSARLDLARWNTAQPDDLYAADAPFQALIRHHQLEQREPALHAAGQAVAGPLDPLVRTNNEARNLPILESWDSIGNRVERVIHHPDWHAAGRLIYGTGVLAAYAEQPPPHRFILSLFYLTAQAGEAGLNCPLACAAGAIRALQVLGTDAQKRCYLPPLLEPDFDRNYTAAQFITEVQGGSDVGQNAVRATPLDPGRRGPGSRWRIDGEKWFCSSADADLFVLTARVTERPGTPGLGLFLVPRHNADGTPNGFRIRRLKEKIGTRSMASAEIDFEGAVGEALGPVERGFKNLMELILDTSRLYNAMACTGLARRAYVVARTYAEQRRAFGARIGEFAAVAENLAWIRADTVASLAATLWLAEIQERVDTATAGAEEIGFLRVALNLNKMRTAMLAHDNANRAIEVLGGNGAIESFSVLPRLLRDNVVYENWEGTHNVLRAQVLRDCRKHGFQEGFFALLEERLGRDSAAELAAERTALETLLAGQPGRELTDLRFRRLADRLATWVMLAAMQPLPELADEIALTRRHLHPPTLDADYLTLVRRLAGG